MWQSLTVISSIFNLVGRQRHTAKMTNIQVPATFFQWLLKEPTGSSEKYGMYRERIGNRGIMQVCIIGDQDLRGMNMNASGSKGGMMVVAWSRGTSDHVYII